MTLIEGVNLTKLNAGEKKLFDKIEAKLEPYDTRKENLITVATMIDKKAIVVHDGYARITPEGYEIRERS